PRSSPVLAVLPSFLPSPRSTLFPYTTLFRSVLTSTKRPSIAAAAAISGLTKCVRAWLPCLPSKFRFDVEAHRPPGGTISSFIPRHILHPASRHSQPASLNILSRPFSSANIFTDNHHGTINTMNLSLTILPYTSLSAFSKSIKRALVHEPINT